VINDLRPKALVWKLRSERTVMPGTLRPSNRSIPAVLAGLMIVGAVGTTADAGRRRLTPRRVSEACPAAGRTIVDVPDGIDAIRVIVDRANPDDATDVTVLAGTSDRTVRAFGAGEFGLAFDEPMRAARIQVALEPVLDAPGAACVSRIELLRGGAVVRTAVIE